MIMNKTFNGENKMVRKSSAPKTINFNTLEWRNKVFHANRRMKELQTLRKPELVSLCSSYYRVFDTAGLGKQEAISFIIEAEYGKNIFTAIELHKDLR
jgi:hypothetical protein